MTLTHRQKCIMESQEDEPIYHYINQEGKDCFTACRCFVPLYTTLSLRPLLKRGRIVMDKSDTITINFGAGFTTVGVRVRIMEVL